MIRNTYSITWTGSAALAGHARPAWLLAYSFANRSSHSLEVVSGKGWPGPFDWPQEQHLTMQGLHAGPFIPAIAQR